MSWTISGSTGYASLIVLAANAILSNDEALCFEGASLTKVLRVSPLVCLYEVLWLSVRSFNQCLWRADRIGPMEQTQGFTDIIVTPRRLGRWLLRGFASAAALRLLLSYQQNPWAASFPIVYVLHWVVSFTCRPEILHVQ